MGRKGRPRYAGWTRHGGSCRVVGLVQSRFRREQGVERVFQHALASSRTRPGIRSELRSELRLPSLLECRALHPTRHREGQEQFPMGHERGRGRRRNERPLPVRRAHQPDVRPFHASAHRFHAESDASGVSPAVHRGGDYGKIKALARPDSYEFVPYDKPLGFNPDFHQRSLRGNVVLRWEYQPGSVLFVVWSQNRSASPEVNNPTLDAFDNLKSSFTDDGQNLFLVKMDYWFGM